MPSFPFTAHLKYNGMISSSPPCCSLACNSYTVTSLSERKPRNVHAWSRSSSSVNIKSLHSQRHTSFVSLNAFDARNSESGSYHHDNEALDAVLKLYSALKSNNTQDLSDILADECRCVCNFLSFFHAFQGKKQVLEFFSYLTRMFGKNVEIVVKATLHDGMCVGVEWKFESDKIHVPLGKGLSFHICQTYKGKALIRNIEMFMEPLLYFEPFRLKMMATLTMLMEKIGSFMAHKSQNQKNIVLALLYLAAFLFFLRLVLLKAIS